jgi:regulator of protease activity HflC (stomatin/prohibitin superfamily)
MKTFNITGKLVGTVSATLVATIIGLNSYTIVEDGSAKTGKLFGEIKPEVYEAGFHVVNPLVDMTEFDIKENMFILDNVTIPSQDKFKSNADVTVQWSIDPTKLPTLQRTIGRQEQIQNKVLVQPLLSILREAGRDVNKAQDLFKADVQDKIQSNVLAELKAVSNPYGIKIHAVYLKDITLPEVIQRSIVKTKELEEQEAQERARLKQQELIYARQTAEAEAQAKSAEQNKIAAQHKTDARAYEKRVNADAELYAKEKESEGNTALAKSVTKDLLALRDKEIALIGASNWKGGCTQDCTELSSDTATQPLYHMNRK